jgi:hypothetical protein
MFTMKVYGWPGPELLIAGPSAWEAFGPVEHFCFETDSTQF